MLKKIAMFSAAATVAFTTAGFADNLYIGIGGSYNLPIIDQHPVTGIANTARPDVEMTDQSAGGRLFLGYNFCLGDEVTPVWAGIEAGARISNSKIEGVDGNNGNVSTAFFKSEYGFDLGVRLGTDLGSYARPYVTVAWAIDRQKMITSASRTSATAVAAHTKKWDNGVRFGLGTDLNVSDEVSLRLEFTQTRYQQREGIKAIDNAAFLGLAYNFNLSAF